MECPLGSSCSRPPDFPGPCLANRAWPRSLFGVSIWKRGSRPCSFELSKGHSAVETSPSIKTDSGISDPHVEIQLLEFTRTDLTPNP